ADLEGIVGRIEDREGSDAGTAAHRGVVAERAGGVRHAGGGQKDQHGSPCCDRENPPSPRFPSSEFWPDPAAFYARFHRSSCALGRESEGRPSGKQRNPPEQAHSEPFTPCVDRGSRKKR